MRRMLLLLGAAMLTAAVSGVAQAREWWIVSLDGNRCLDSNGIQEETSRLGVGFLWITPEQLLMVLRHDGLTPSAAVQKLPGAALMDVVSWTDPYGQRVGRIFFSDQPDCALGVAHAVNSGMVPALNELR